MNGRKILIVTNRVPYPLKDGGNLAMFSIIDGYHRSGWQVHLLTMNTSRHFVDPKKVNEVFGHLHGLTIVEIDNKLNWKALLKNFLFSKEPEHARRFYSDDFREKLKEVLVSFTPDAIQIESVFLSTYMSAIRKYSEAVTILRMHNIEYQIWQGLAKKTKNKLKAFYLDNLSIRVRNFERDAWKQYDLILAITEKDAHLVRRLEEVAGLVVAPFSIDTTRFAPVRQTGEWVGYHIGAMDWRANQEGIRWFLEKTWPLVRKAVPGFKFFFAGRNMGKEFMNMEITGVQCMGEVPDADAFIADKKILIVPLWSGGGIRVKILEAMAAGKVVIATSKAIKGIEARPQEHYLRVHTPAEFAKAIKWCLEHKDAAEKMAENARALVIEKYEQTRTMKLITDEVEFLISKK